MRLTTKGRFAVTAMIDLALRDTHGPVTLASISERQGISLSYLEQLFGKLRRHGIVESVRGPGGGYNMGKTLQCISVAEIIAAVDEPLDATMCGGEKDCHEQGRVGGGLLDNKQKGQCMTHELWANLNKKMQEYLGSVSLGDLVRQQREREAARVGRVGRVGDGAGAAGQTVTMTRAKAMPHALSAGRVPMPA